jgi:molecular chaperone GrpE
MAKSLLKKLLNLITMSEEKELNEQTHSKTSSEINETAEAVENSSAENIEQEEIKTEPTPEEKLAELNDRYLRLYSEFDNYRKRTNKEKIDLIATASAGVLKELITTLDDFERAIANNENVEDLTTLKEGFHLIYNKLKTTLENKGLKVMLSKGESFDSELHEAIANIPAPSEDLVGKIVDDVEKGYYLHDKVIRYAKVVVGQ